MMLIPIVSVVPRIHVPLTQRMIVIVIPSAATWTLVQKIQKMIKEANDMSTSSVSNINKSDKLAVKDAEIIKLRSELSDIHEEQE